MMVWTTPKRTTILYPASCLLTKFWGLTVFLIIGLGQYVYIRDCPIIRTDLQIRTMFGYGWIGGFTGMACSDFQ